MAGTPGTTLAATFSWDPGTTGGPAGGTGNWDTLPADLFWWDGTNNVTWDNIAKNIALFSGTPGTVTLTEPITAGGLIFDVDGYTIAGNATNTLTLAAPTGFSSPTIRVSNLGQRATISALLAGTSGFAKTGDGSLLLTNSSNSFSGDVVINGGSLVITDQGQLGAGTTTVSVNGLANVGNPGFSGGQLVLQGGLAGMTFNRGISVTGRGPGAANATGGLLSVGNNTISGNLVVGSTGSEGRVLATHGITTLAGGVQLGTGAGNIFYGNGNWVVSGLVTGFDTGNDRFIKTGNLIGTTMWLQNVNNNYVGTLRIDSGTVRVSDNGALGAGTVARSVDLNGGFLEIHTDAPNFGTRNFYSRGNTNGIFADRALGGTGLNQTVVFGNMNADNATFTFNGRNGYNLTLNGSAGAGTDLTWAGGANLTFNNNSSGLLTFDGNLRKSDTTARSAVFGGNSDLLFTGFLERVGGTGGAHTLTKNGIGTLTLAYNGPAPLDPFTGATTINGGTLVFSTAAALPTGAINIGNATTTSGALTYVGAGETLSNDIRLNTTTANAYINASGTGALIIDGAITAVAGTKTLVLGGTNTDDNTIASALPSTATTNLQKVGTGTWLLAGANLHTGSTTVSTGRLKIQDSFSGTSRDLLPDAAALIFNVDTLTNSAGGIFQYLGDGINASAETIGTLTPTAGAGTVMVTAGTGGTAALTFASLGTVAAGSGVNFVTNTGGSVTITGATDTNGILNAHLFFNGADFASGSAVGAATYTTEAGGASLLAGNTTPYLVNTTDIAAQDTATINAGIKFSDTRNLTLSSGATLTLNNGAATVSGGLLVTGGSSVVISGGTAITSGGAADLVFRTDGAGDTLTLNTPIASSTTGGWTKLGLGTLVLGAANANTTAAPVNINEGTVRMTAGGKLGADSIDLNLRQGATLDLNGVNLGTAASGTGSVDFLNGAGTITNSAASTVASIRIGNGNSGSYFSGLIENGAGQVALVKNGSGTIHLTGMNTFTGPVTLNAGNLDVTRLANIGQASGIGMGDATDEASNAASIVFNGGALRYVGTNTAGAVEASQSPSVSIDRLFTLAGSGTIASFGSYGNVVQARAANHATLIFNNTAAVAFSGTGARTLTLRGDSLGDNQIDLQLIDNPGGGALSVTKSDAGFWILGNVTNSYSGATTINGGTLRVGDDGSAATRTLPTTSPLVLGLTTGAGVLQTSGTFARPIAATATAGNGTVTFGGTTGGGGFAASTAPLKVNLGGAGATLQWGAGGFVGTGGVQSLFLNSSTSWADVDFQNGIDLNVTTGTVQRTIQIDDNGNTGLDFATISGVISNSGAGTGGITLVGGGTLILGDANTYNGNTRMTNGPLIVSSIGNATGTTASSLGASGGTLELATNGTNQFLYVGPGETASRPISINAALTAARTHRIDSSGSGALVLTNLTNNKTGNFALNLEIRGTNSDGNMITSVLGNGGGTGGLNLSKFDYGVWILNPTAANTFTGVLTAGGGTLGLTADGIGAASQLNFSGGAIMAHGGDLAISTLVQLNNAQTAVFAGSNSITINGNVQKQAGTSDNTLSNNLENGAVLTVNGNYVNLQTATATRSVFIRGYGSTVWNGLIQNNSATSLTRFDIRIADNASFTLGGDNKGAALGLTGGILLGQGTLIIGHTGGLGPVANNLILDGGVLTSTVDLSGANAVANSAIFAGDQVTIDGSQNIEFAGTVVNSGGNRFIRNNLDTGKTLALSGTVNLSESNTARTLTIRGSGDAVISGVVANGGTGNGGLAFSGTGSLALTGANTATGALTVNRNTVILSGTAGGNWSGSVVLNPIGVLRLDNSGGDNPAPSGRLNDTGAITGAGGTLELIGSATGTTEVVGALTLNSVQTFITMSGPGPNLLSFASVASPNTGSSLNLAGVSNLGTTNKVTFGGTLPANFQINSVMPRAFIAGGDFATYDVTNGVMAFSNYNPTSTTDINLAAATDTVEINAGMTTSSLMVNKTINALKIDGSGLSLGGAGKTLTLSAAAILNTGGNNSLNTAFVSFGGITGFVQVDAGTTLNVNAALTGSAGMANARSGTLVLNTGTFITSTTNVLRGTLTLNAGLNTLYPNQIFNINDGATLDLNGNAQYVGQLLDPGTLPEAGGLITSLAGTGTFVTNMNAGSATIATTINGNVNFGRVGGNTLTLESVNTYSGATVIMGGILQLQDDATILNTSSIDINAATLTLNNNSSLQRAVYDRVGNTTPIALRGGTINFAGKVSDPSTEAFGALTSAQGANTITVNTGGTGTAGAFASADVTFASLTRSTGTTMNFTSSTTAIGSIGNFPRIVFTSSPQTFLDGVLGAWAIVNSTDYAAYNSVNGVGTAGNGGFAGYSGDFGSGKITGLHATGVGLSTLLSAATTTTGMLRLSGASINDILFTDDANVLNLQLGGILRSNDNVSTAIGSMAIRGVITSGNGELVVYNNQSTVTINSVIQGATSLVKSGAGTLELTAANTYTGGTAINQGTLLLSSFGNVVIPAGGLTITNATVTEFGAGQIATTNDVRLNGSSIFTLGGSTTLASLTFDNNGGTATPTVTVGAGTTLTLTGPTPVTVTSNNALTVPIISAGTLALTAGPKTFDIGAIQVAGQTYTEITPSLNITSVITGAGTSINKTGGGLLQLSAQNTFDGGINVTAGGIVLGASSTATTVLAGLVSGPLGTGTLNMAAGTSLLVDNASRTIANAVTFVGNPIFNNTALTGVTLTLNGPISFTAGGALTIEVVTPNLNVALNGAMSGWGSITSLTKLGAGNLSSLNITGINSTAAVTIANPNGAFTLLSDGDGTSGFETLNLGAVNLQSSAATLALTIGRAGTGINYSNFTTAANKVLAPTSFTALSNGITLTNNNGFGLVVPDAFALTTAFTPTFSVSAASNSLFQQGLTLSGVISGGITGSGNVVLTKAGAGTLVLTNDLNTFGGGGATIDIIAGILAVTSDGALGDPTNVVQLNVNSTTQGLRAADTFATSRTIVLNQASNMIEVVRGKTLTLNSPFVLGATTNNLQKNDLGTLVLAAPQPTWAGTFTILQGVVRISDGAALGTLAGATTLPNLGGALELTGGAGVADNITINASNNVTSNGVAGGGAIRSVSGVNFLSGLVTITASTATNNMRAATITADAGSTLTITGGIQGGVGVTGDSNRHGWVGFGGAGDVILTTNPITFTGDQGAAGIYQLNKFGTGTLNLQVTDAFLGRDVMIKQGTLRLDGSGTLGVPDIAPANAGFVYLNPTGVLTLDNSGGSINNRLNGRNLNVSGADVNISGGAGSPTSETVGLFTLREGKSVFTLQASGSQPLSFTTGVITRSGGSSLLIRASNFGQTAAAGVATFQGGNFAYVGQLGATGAANKSIVPWALGDTNVAGAGIGFVTADSLAAEANTGTNILRLLNPVTEQVTGLTAPATANAWENLSLSTTPNLPGVWTVNSLQLNAGGGLTALGPAVLTLDSGALLALAGNTGIDFSSEGYLTTTSNRELIIHSVGDLDLNVPIVGTTGGLNKSGPGALTVTGNNRFSGTIWVNDGTLKLNGGNQTFTPGHSLLLNEGGVLDLNGAVQQFNFLESRLTAALAVNDLFSPDTGGIVKNTAATQATLALRTSAVTFAGSIQDNVAVALSYVAGSISDWTLYSDLTYTGPTLLNGGRIILNDNARLSGTSSIEISNATMLFNSSNISAETVNFTDRVNDSAPITLRGAMLQLRSRAGLYTTETFGAVTLAAGNTIVDFAEGGTAINQVDATFTSLTRAAGQHGTVRFLNIDGTPNDDQRLFINTLNGVATTNVGDGLTNNLIGGWATFEREFASYTPGMGVAGLNTAGYAGYSPITDPNLGTATDNIRIALPVAGATVTLTGNTTLNSFNMQAPGTTTGDSTLDLGGNTLTLASGGLILAPIAQTAASGLSNNMSVVNGSLTAGTTSSPADLYLHALSWFNGQADTTGNADVIVDAIIKNNSAGGAVTLVIDGNNGRGTLAATNDVFLTASNTYTGGTFVNSGRVNLNNASANGTTQVAIPGDLTIAGGFSSNPGVFSDRNTTVVLSGPNQIAYSAIVTVMGSSTLDLNNNDQTLAGVIFNDTGGNTPTLSIGAGTLTLQGNITASGNNLGAISTITTSGAGQLSLAGSTRTITVNPVEWNGTVLNPLLPNLQIAGLITGTGSEGIIKAGNGLLQLDAQNTFTGGVNVTGGGLILGANSTPTTVTAAGVTSGPVGTGTLTMSSGTTLLVPNASRTIANAVIFAGDPIFDNTATATVTLTLNGPITLPGGDVNIQINAFNMTVALNGLLTNPGAITSITKVGPGNLSSINLTGINNPGVDITINNITGTLSLLNDGNGTGDAEVFNFGDITFEVPTAVPTLTIGRAGVTPDYPTALNKTFAATSFSSLANGLTLVNNHGFGLRSAGNVTLNSGAVFSVANASNSNVVQGLELTGVVSGAGFTKIGNGAMVLSNSGNSYTGDVVINVGTVAASSDGALGNSANLVVLNPTSGTATFRATDNITTSVGSPGTELEFAL